MLQRKVFRRGNGRISGAGRARQGCLIIGAMPSILRPDFSASRRHLLLALAATMTAAPTLGEPGGTLRIGLTPVFLDDQVSFLEKWRSWLELALAKPVAFVQRGSYREIVELLRAGKLDFAWLCGYPYIRFSSELQLVAVPLWRGQPYYQSYLIVPSDDVHTRNLADLRGKIFAFSDPDSNSGYLYPQYLLASRGENPENFFARSFFTWAHRKVVEAVGIGLAQGGAVDGYVWETLAEFRPDLTTATRICDRSPRLGYPPFVARGDISPDELERFRTVLLRMSEDVAGAELLHRLRLNGFAPARPELYQGIADMARQVRRK